MTSVHSAPAAVGLGDSAICPARGMLGGLVVGIAFWSVVGILLF